MAISHQTVYLDAESGTTAIGPTANHAGRDITIQNIGATDAFIGGEGVDSNSFGYRLSPNSAWSVELRAGDHLYAWAQNTTLAILACGLED